MIAATARADSYFCTCGREDCWCMSMIPVERIPPDVLGKIARLESDYVLPCLRCAAGVHDLDPKTAAERQEVVRRAIIEQLAKEKR